MQNWRILTQIISIWSQSLSSKKHTIKVAYIMCVLYSSDIKALCEEQSQI